MRKLQNVIFSRQQLFSVGCRESLSVFIVSYLCGVVNVKKVKTIGFQVFLSLTERANILNV